MEGLLNLTGSRVVELEVAGSTWRITPWRMRRYGEMEQYIISCRGAGGPTCNYATLDEVAQFERSPHGSAWLIWKCLEPEHPEINSIEAAYDWMEAAGSSYFEAVMQVIGMAQEKDLLKNSDTPEPTTTDDAVERRGHSCSGACASDTAGDRATCST